ncbi:unnamed protein product [Rangifer tarandus platyrhynchus]|uniref:Uncharacterized protein n=2 Tax=Rangifer tarandus platyrhynchus TaxID=3082113 RepID=A0ABN8ZJG3_RANTA|nr:unnamed protein product [Rangifer tarandus platyrhynchus]
MWQGALGSGAPCPFLSACMQVTSREKRSVGLHQAPCCLLHAPGAPLHSLQVFSPPSSPPHPVSASSLCLPLLPLFLPYLVLTRNASSCPCSAWPYIPPEPEKWAQNGCPGWASEGPHFKGTGKRSVSPSTDRSADVSPGRASAWGNSPVGHAGHLAV